MERCQITVRYVQSSGEIGEFKNNIFVSNFSEVIPELLKYINKTEGQIIQYIISGVSY